jgi:uncharacterized membrane protein (DUF4010 family)
LSDPWFVSFLVALGLGLLIGIERERHKGQAPEGAAPGLRTFSIAGISGLVAVKTGGVVLLSATTVAAAILVAFGTWASRKLEPGLTSGLALVATVLIGGLAEQFPLHAAAAGVSVAVLLAGRDWLHRFARSLLTESELRDGLILAAATFVVLPLLPDHPIDPFGAINPRSVWTVALLMMAISAVGYIAARALGPRYGLPAAGFATGFISSTVTIGAMGGRAREQPALMRPAASGATLSTVATAIQMAAVLSATSLAALAELTPSLLLAGGAALVYAVALGMRLVRQPEEASPASQPGRAFNPQVALIFAATLAVVLLATTIIGTHYGTAGVIVTAALAGFIDAHSPAIAVATMVATGQIGAPDAVVPILLAFSANSVSKIVVALVTGGPPFALRIAPGIGLVMAGAWLGTMIS